MSGSIVPPSELTNFRSQEVAYMNEHLTKLHWTLRGVLVVAAVGVSLVFWLSKKSYDKAIAAANSQYAVLQSQLRETTAQLAQNAAIQAQNSRQVQVIERTVTVRDQQAQQDVSQVTTPDLSLAQIAQDSARYLDVTPVQLPSQDLLGFTPEQTQGLIASGIEKETAEKDDADTKKQIGLLQDNVGLLQTDLKTSQADVRSCQKDVNDYRKAAKRGKWARRLEIAGAFVLGVLVHTPLP